MRSAALSCDDTLDMFIEHKAKPTHPLRLVQKDSPMASIKPHVWTFTLFAAALQELASVMQVEGNRLLGIRPVVMARLFEAR